MLRLETNRLILRTLSAHDAPFILELLNEPSFLRYVGDKGVRTMDDARNYILTGPMASYDRFGFGLDLVELKESREPIGICGLLKRDWLEDVDIGFAFLPRFWKAGYGLESASAVVADARVTRRLRRIVAITAEANVASIHLLTKLGFVFERTVRSSEEGPALRLFASTTS